MHKNHVGKTDETQQSLSSDIAEFAAQPLGR